MLSPHTYTHTYAESNGPKIEEKTWYDGSHTRLWGEGNKQKTTNTFFKVIAVDYMKINKHVRLSVAVSPIIIRHTRCRIYVCTIIALGIQVFFWVVGGECVGGNEWILIQTPYTILPTEHTQSIGGIFQISATFWVCCRPKIPQSFIHFLPQHWTSNSRFNLAVYLYGHTMRMCMWVWHNSAAVSMVFFCPDIYSYTISCNDSDNEDVRRHCAGWVRYMFEVYIINSNTVWVLSHIFTNETCKHMYTIYGIFHAKSAEKTSIYIFFI